MTCTQAQHNLSLYLYGELEFAVEDELETHLGGCAFCQLALAREKEWHASLNEGQESLRFEFLAECRTKLQRQLAAAPTRMPDEVWGERLRRQAALFFQMCQTWPARVAIAGFLLVLGFGAGRWSRLNAVDGTQDAALSLAGPFTRVRSIQPESDGRVRLVLDRVQPGQLVGAVTDADVRKLLLSAAHDASNPAIRVDSVEFLTGQTSPDVEQALLASLQQDPNAAVRMKALEALRPFASNQEEREALISVMRHDQDPGLRSEAIDVLLSGVGQAGRTPDVLRAIQQGAEPSEPDDYIRARCAQFLRMADGRAVEAY